MSPGVRAVAVDLGIDGDLRADGAGNEVPHGRLRRLGCRDLAGAELLLDQRMVAGELLDVCLVAGDSRGCRLRGRARG